MVVAAQDPQSWRSPPPQETPLAEPASLPTINPLNDPTSSAVASTIILNDLIQPSFLPPCEHGEEDGDMHAHAFDLLSLSNPPPALPRSSHPVAPPTSTVVPASVPTNSSVLSATRPSTVVNGNVASPGSVTKARRMSSSTTGVLGRGKLGLTGESSLGLGGVSEKTRPTLSNHTPSYSGSTPIPNRRPAAPTGGTGSSPTPQLFDFAKTDRRPSQSNGARSGAIPPTRSANASIVPASLPTRSTLLANARHIHPPPIAGDMELDMAFDGDDDDDEEEGVSGRSGSAELDMDMDGEDDGEIREDWQKLALGTGSGGVKGRRKGMVFKCENCAKEYRHPSCLVKHRWEHSPHWKEPTQLSMSKHQQVQMLEAAAILAHLDNNQGRGLPTDKSLWPAIISPPGGETLKLRRTSISVSRDPSSVRSPQSTTAPLTPSSLRESSTLAAMGKPRKSSPGSDSTTSSMGDGYVPQARSNLGLRNGIARPTRPLGIEAGQVASSLSSSVPGPGTPLSVGSLPNELAGLHFQSGTPTGAGVSPIPHRGMPLSLKARAGLVGGGMFGAINTSMPSSSVRSGAMADDEDENDSLGTRGGSRAKSSSEEAEERRRAREGEEWGMAMEMEL